MTTDASRRLRADAARNSEKILRAAREIYAEQGPDAMLEDIARHAGVGIATLYRRFPNKGELVRAALDQAIAEEISPAIEQALNDDDPKHGLAILLEAALCLAARERNTLAAARRTGAISAEVTAPFHESLALLTRRGQQAGLIRADIVPDDLIRWMAMLVSVLWTMDARSDGWRRYVVLVLDALSPEGASLLPPPVPLLEAQQEGDWPL
ncbi:helix-turn-helix domain-containing protein [Nonomuraea sp. NPDC050202]|jgi:AcrR family transcriptional regulator|uniref:TetR/AcrR family transcriptional regulator n=1 Tax=Nonomuraea sp. NPDC050202 TaxID=3155035 RepID=UPI0033FF7876